MELDHVNFACSFQSAALNYFVPRRSRGNLEKDRSVSQIISKQFKLSKQIFVLALSGFILSLFFGFAADIKYSHRFKFDLICLSV